MMLHPTAFSRRAVATLVLLTALAVPVAAVPLQAAAPPSTVGLTVTNSIISNVPAQMELRANGKILASGTVQYHNLLWRGNLPKGTRVQLYVRWNGITKQTGLKVTRHGTYMGPKLTSKGRIEIVYTPQ